MESPIKQDAFVTPVSEKESMEFMNEGLLKASSAARQLARIQNHPIWFDVSILLDEIRNNGINLANSKSLGRQKTLKILDIRENALNKKMNALNVLRENPTSKKFLLK